MTSPGKNLKSVIEYFGVRKNEMARELGVDPSLISGWISGQRRLRAATPQMDALADYILAHSKRIHDLEWLNAQFEAEGLQVDISSVYRVRQNLIMWLASDGEALRRNMRSQPQAVAAKTNATRKSWTTLLKEDSAVRLGYLDIALELEPILSGLAAKSVVEIFMSSDQIATLVNGDIAALMLRSIEKNDLNVSLIVCVSGDTQAMSVLIGTYMGALVSGHVRLSVVHGLTQTVTNQMHLIIPGVAVMLVTETPDVTTPPVAVVIREPAFVTEVQRSFAQTVRYAQPILNIYGDDFSRNILEIIYREFCTPGALDVVKDSINPMYMPEHAYNRVLSTNGHSDAEYAWRSAEFARFKSGMDETLKGGSVFREILSLSRLNQIVKDGFCRMPGLYFMKKGFVLLDAEGCISILDGYIRYLETVPNFHLLILDDITMLHMNNCWQLKQNQHLAINHWSGPEPVMIHSDQLMLLREFQAHFDRLWALGTGAIGCRTGVIAILRDVVVRLKTDKYGRK